MNHRIFCLLLATLLLIASTARSQSIEVHLFAKYTDEPIVDLLILLEATGSFKVEVDAALAERKVTVEFEGETPLAALRLVAKVMKVELTKTSANRYRLAPGDPTKSGAREGNSAPEPAWKKAIRARLLESKVDGAYEKKKLQAVLVDLSRASGITIHLDPRVEKARSAAQLEVSLTPIPNPTSVMGVLTTAVGGAKLEYDIRWSGVFVSTPERIQALAKRSLVVTKKTTEKQAALEKKLVEKKISVSLKGSTVAKALGRIGRLGGIRIRHEAADLIEQPPVVLTVKSMPLGDVLGSILIPRGLQLRIEKGVFVVQPVKAD
jgi:hypothetical protein